MTTPEKRPPQLSREERERRQGLPPLDRLGVPEESGGRPMSGDLDALLARAEQIEPVIRRRLDISVEVADVMLKLMVALRESRADYLAALDVIARLTEGWDADHGPNGNHWLRDPIADDWTDTSDLMSERHWRVYCDAAQRATRGAGA